jgi:hypothetical protein
VHPDARTTERTSARNGGAPVDRLLSDAEIRLRTIAAAGTAVAVPRRAGAATTTATLVVVEPE